MYCKKCGAFMDDSAKFCPACGANVSQGTEEHTSTKHDGNASPKSRLIAALLCWFFGIIGVHRFYVGRTASGIFMIFTIGGLGIWALIDLIILICGSFKDSDGKVISNWLE